MPKARRRIRIKTPPLLFDATQRVIARIQRTVDGAFLTYWTSTSGSVCDNDVMAMHDILRARGEQKTITLFMKSDGGSGMTSLRRTPRARCGFGMMHRRSMARLPKSTCGAAAWSRRQATKRCGSTAAVHSATQVTLR